MKSQAYRFAVKPGLNLLLRDELQAHTNENSAGCLRNVPGIFDGGHPIVRGFPGRGVFAPNQFPKLCKIIPIDFNEHFGGMQDWLCVHFSTFVRVVMGLCVLVLSGLFKPTWFHWGHSTRTLQSQEAATLLPSSSAMLFPCR